MPFLVSVRFLGEGKFREADVIISNHDLLLSDLALGGGVILRA